MLNNSAEKGGKALPSRCARPSRGGKEFRPMNVPLTSHCPERGIWCN
jgi:hypothetical protein